MDRSSSPPLTLAEAHSRAAVISCIHYELFLDLTRANLFTGSVTVSFHYAGEDPSQAWLDADGMDYSVLEIEEIDSKWRRECGRLYCDSLSQGRNVCQVKYRGKFRRNGTGLHRFLDPVDRCTYIYSYFCPFFAHRVFPCFDQPDLKATLSLRVKVMPDWKAYSNVGNRQSPIAAETFTEGQKDVVFEESPKLSTYVMCITAGDFVECSDPDFRIPLLLAYRHSLASYVPEQEILDYTRRGIEYYEQLFETPMPFPQYKQILVPEMYMGAMENAACVIINDNNLWKESPSRSEHIYFYNTILHELSHMWFGNLVTFIWWDDIWLNESFATYISYLAQSEVFGEDVWPSFYIYCARGFAIDITNSTHSVHIPINNTEEAQSSFDSITYSKGAAIIRALVGEVGRSGFFKGIGEYFERYQWGNVGMKDLIEVLQRHTEADLTSWCSHWVSSPGVNQLSLISPSFAPSLTIRQLSFPKGSLTLRPHSLSLLKYYDRSFSFYDESRVRLAAEGTVAIANNKPAKFVFLNLDFSEYVLVAYSREQMEVMARLEKNPLEETSHRAVLWTSFWYMVQTCSLSPPSYLSILHRWLPSEPSEDISDYLLGTAQTCIFSYLPFAHIESYSDSLFKLLKNLFLTGSDRLKPVYKKRIPHFVFSLTSVSFVFEAFAWFSFSRTNKWRLLMTKSAYLSLSEVREMLDEELRRDGDSDMVRRFRYYCEASACDNKAATWDLISSSSDSYSLPELELLMEGFNLQCQGDLLSSFRPQVFALLQQLISSGSREIAEAYIDDMLPHYESPGMTITTLLSLQTDRTWAKQLIEKTVDRLKVRKECQDMTTMEIGEG